MDQQSGKFEYITALPGSFSKSETPQDTQSAKDLRETYNRLFNENKAKHENLKKLKRLVEDHQKRIEDQIDISEKSEIIQQLQGQVNEKEKICKQEAIEQAILINKRENLKVASGTLRGKLIELQKNFDRITTNYGAFNNSSILSRYSLLLINKALEEHQHCFDKSKNVFKTNILKLETKLRNAAQVNTRIMQRASSVDDQIASKRKSKMEFFQQYENTLHNFREIATNKKYSAKCLEIYKDKFKTIRGFVEKDTNFKPHGNDFDENYIKKVIQKLKDLEYRSESLNFTYQKLSEQEAHLNSELSTLKSELCSIQNSSDDGDKFETFSHPAHKSHKKSSELEFFIIKIYFQFIETLYETFERLATNPKLIQDRDFESKLNKCLDLLKDVKGGIPKRRPFNVERFVIEKLIGKQVQHENVSNKYLSSIALNNRELTEIFLECFPNELANSKLFVSCVENCLIMKIFLDKETLKGFLHSNGGRDLYTVMVNLTVKCNLVLDDKFRSLAAESEKIFVGLKKRIYESQGVEGLLEMNSQDGILSLPFELKIKKSRSQCSSPYKVTEKPMKKPMENIKAEPIPIDFIQTKDSKSVPRVYSLTSVALKRQKVMKEILENQKKETLLRTIEKKISKHSEKQVSLPYMKKFVLRSGSTLEKLAGSAHSARRISLFNIN